MVRVAFLLRSPQSGRPPNAPLPCFAILETGAVRISRWNDSRSTRIASDVALCERVSLEMTELHDANWAPASRWHLLMAWAVYLSISNQTEAVASRLRNSRAGSRGGIQPVSVSMRGLIDIASEAGHFEEAVTLCRVGCHDSCRSIRVYVGHCTLRS